jgi:diguanylate cyclase (GGDEF)-like protein
MIEPSTPNDETPRLKALRALNILDTPIEKRFEAAVRITKSLFNVPIVAISLVDKDRQWFKAAEGLEVRETPRSISFCGHAILGDDVYVVEDATKDERFCDNPLVTEDPNIRFYAGYPIRAAGGEKLGTLCLIDKTPRPFDAKDAQNLIDMASIVEALLRSDQQLHSTRWLLDEIDTAKLKSLKDPLTELWNRAGGEAMLEKIVSSDQDPDIYFGIGILDIDHFKKVNDTYGHTAGDQFLKSIAKSLLHASRDSDTVCRWGGEEFLIIFQARNVDYMQLCFQRIVDMISRKAINIDGQLLSVTCTIGATVFNSSQHETWENCLEHADKLLYQGKEAGRNRLVFEHLLPNSPPT